MSARTNTTDAKEVKAGKKPKGPSEQGIHRQTTAGASDQSEQGGTKKRGKGHQVTWKARIWKNTKGGFPTAQQPRRRRIPAGGKPHKKMQEAKPPGMSPNPGKPKGQRGRTRPQLKGRGQENQTSPRRPRQHKYANKERSTPQRSRQCNHTPRKATGTPPRAKTPRQTNVQKPAHPARTAGKRCQLFR